MDAARATWAEEIEALSALLAEEATLLDLRRSQLASLSGAILDRDEDAVGRILDQIERAQELQAATDEGLQALRCRLAGRLGLGAGEMSLSVLIDRLDQPYRRELSARREQIIDLAERLQREHMQAVMLLNECARINRLLLESLLPSSGSVRTYSASGSDLWRTGSGLVDAER